MVGMMSDDIVMNMSRSEWLELGQNVSFYLPDEVTQLSKDQLKRVAGKLGLTIPEVEKAFQLYRSGQRLN